MRRREDSPLGSLLEQPPLPTAPNDNPINVPVQETLDPKFILAITVAFFFLFEASTLGGAELVFDDDLAFTWLLYRYLVGRLTNSPCRLLAIFLSVIIAGFHSQEGCRRCPSKAIPALDEMSVGSVAKLYSGAQSFRKSDVLCGIFWSKALLTYDSMSIIELFSRRLHSSTVWHPLLAPQHRYLCRQARTICSPLTAQPVMKLSTLTTAALPYPHHEHFCRRKP